MASMWRKFKNDITKILCTTTASTVYLHLNGIPANVVYSVKSRFSQAVINVRCCKAVYLMPESCQFVTVNLLVKVSWLEDAESVTAGWGGDAVRGKATAGAPYYKQRLPWQRWGKLGVKGVSCYAQKHNAPVILFWKLDSRYTVIGVWKHCMLEGYFVVFYDISLIKIYYKNICVCVYIIYIHPHTCSTSLI